MKQHREFIDTAKGIGAFMVMLSHIEHTPVAYQNFIAPIFLAIFFYISGVFLSTSRYKDPMCFIKGKLLKLLIPWVIISYVSAIFNVSTIRDIIIKPNTFFVIIIQTTHRILIGKAIWFVPCLIASLLISYLLFYLLKDNTRILVCSFVLSIIGILFAREGEYTLWSVNTALVNQFFVILGALTRNRLLDNHGKIKKYGILYTILSFSTYLVTLNLLQHAKLYSGFGIRLNFYDNVFSYLLLNCLGILFILFLSITVQTIPLITYMGNHSLYYFAFGAHGYRIGRILLDIIAGRWDIILNPYLASLFICVVASAFMAGLGKLVDYFVPILNGKMEIGPFAQRMILLRRMDF